MPAACVHQLQVVDHDKAQLVPQPPAFRLDFSRSNRRIIVHIDIQASQHAGRAGDLDPIVPIQVTSLELLRLDQRFAGQKAARKLFLAHFQLEHTHARPFFIALRLALYTRLCRVERNVERKRGLTHAGTRRNQYQVGFVQACQRRVQRVKSG